MLRSAYQCLFAASRRRIFCILRCWIARAYNGGSSKSTPRLEGHCHGAVTFYLLAFEESSSDVSISECRALAAFRVSAHQESFPSSCIAARFRRIASKKDDWASSLFRARFTANIKATTPSLLKLAPLQIVAARIGKSHTRAAPSAP